MEEKMEERVIKQISETLNITEKQILTVLALLEEGNTVPFIARYRKEATNGLNDEEIFEINKEYEYGIQLLKRKEDVIRLIDEKGLLTPELEEKILSSTKLVEVEDLYRPFKEKKKTKATEAIKNGLEPLAKIIMSFKVRTDINSIAEGYINENVKTIEDAITGAKYIIAEWVSDNAYYRKFLRNDLYRNGFIETKLKKNAVDEKGVYENYYEYKESVKYIKPHRMLAINRAEKEDVINVSIEYDKEIFHKYLFDKIVKDENNICAPIVKEAIIDSVKRLIFPSVEREVRSELTEKAENQAIEIFSLNLKNLLLTPPMKGKVVLGVDPAYRTGCKLTVVDKTGKLLEKNVVYPHQKFVGENVSPRRVLEAKEIVKTLITKHNVEIVAIGNGTASRETESFISGVIREYKLGCSYIIVSEAGASVYSASDLAREEFPDFEVEERSAISIARRLQDPLSELVKIDPKSIGVGQYQHDVQQKKLTESLDFVVMNAVNSVGVNINTASKALLQYVSGLNKKQAENIVLYRDEIGGFTNRTQIKKVPKLGSKTYEQAIGFLRVAESKEYLDRTSIHPESYAKTKEILAYINVPVEKIGSLEMKEAIDNLSKFELKKSIEIDDFLLEDILDALKSPLRDPRDNFDKPLLRSDVLHLDDLKIGMELQGTVRNVVDFGCFVDCGLKEDGLVHISKMSNSYIKHPSDLVSVGDLVKVYVINIDLKKQKVGLSFIKDKM
jgi:uncharacterized protein